VKAKTLAPAARLIPYPTDAPSLRELVALQYLMASTGRPRVLATTTDRAALRAALARSDRRVTPGSKRYNGRLARALRLARAQYEQLCGVPWRGPVERERAMIDYGLSAMDRLLAAEEAEAHNPERR
jgi:hypothetical protein